MIVDEKDRSLLLAISVVLISAALYYAIHVEYFRILSVVFFLTHTTVIALSPRRMFEKMQEICVIAVLALAMFASAVVLWR